MTTIHRWRAFAVLAVSFFMTIVDLTIVNVALPTIGRDLDFSESGLQWVVTAYGLTFGGLLLLGGRAADLLGRRLIFMLGPVVFTAASLACGLATTDTFLIAMRGLQGLGAAIVLPAALSIVMNMFSEGAERNRALGAWGGIAASGATVGLITGGLLTRYIGWEFIFLLNVPIGAIALALAPRLVPESRLETARRRYDPLGALTVTGGLLLLVYAISTAPQDGWAAAKTISSLAVSGALLVAFFLVEARVEAPLLPLRMLRNRSVAGANAVGFLLGGSFFGFIFVGTLYMQQVLGYSALTTGLAWLAASLTSVALAGLSQLLVTRISAGPVMAAGMAMIAGGGHAGAGARPVLGRPRRAVLRRRRRDRLRVHPDLDRRADRRRRTQRRPRLRAAQHHAAGRRCDRRRRRLDGRSQPRWDTGRRRPAAERGAHRRIPVGPLGVHRHCRAGGSGQLRRPAPHHAGAGAGTCVRRGVVTRTPGTRNR
jgi:EmrB/QacA subfamily drug resistance transporter